MSTHQAADASRQGSFLADLDGQPAFGFIGPNWFASVMGTGIVANAAATLPVRVPGLLTFAEVVWALDVVLLILVCAATSVHWVRHPATARSHLDHPVMAHFYGAPAMALITVGSGALLVGVPVVGQHVAVGIDAVLWTGGTLLGLWTAAVVPVRAFTSHHLDPDSAFGGWLMPVVPPMVSASAGPLLIPHLPAGPWQLAMQLACTVMLGLAVLASVVVIAMVWHRLLRHGIGASAAVPTLWIVLGPPGQSITATHTLGGTAATVLPAPDSGSYEAFGLIYELPVWGFGLLWLAVVGAVTVRTARRGLPFSLTWWSFTFPVGTFVTGTSGLAAATGAGLFVVSAGVLYVGLVLAWVTVATRTARGVWSGHLLRAPA